MKSSAGSNDTIGPSPNFCLKLNAQRTIQAAALPLHNFKYPEGSESSRNNSVTHSKAESTLAALMWLRKSCMAAAA